MSEKNEEIITGVFDDVTSQDYHAGRFKDYIGHTGLLKILKSPAHFKSFQEEESKTTQAMEFGTAAHIVMLENPHKRIAIADLPSKKSKAYDEFYQQSMMAGFEVVVLKEEWDRLMRMRDKIFEHNLAKNLIFQGKPELTGLWVDDKFEGIKCKIRADYWINDSNLSIIVDYKTTSDAEHEKFQYSAYDFGYDIQGYWYTYGAKKLFSPRNENIYFFLIAQEKESPFAINVFRMTPEFLKIGESRVNKAMTTYWQCIENPHLFKKAYPDDKYIDLLPPYKATKEWPDKSGNKQEEI